MKINALFIENKANLGKPQFAGFVETFDDVPEMCAYALPNFFSDKTVCKTFAKKLRECFDAKGDEEGFFDSIIKTQLYGWTNTWKIVKNEITIYVMKQLVSLDPLKSNSGINESNYYETGALEFDDDGECHDKEAIAKVWHDVLKYPGKEDSFVVGDTTYLFCIVLSRALTNHFWAVYPGCKDPKQAEKKLPEYLTRNRPEK